MSLEVKSLSEPEANALGISEWDKASRDRGVFSERYVCDDQYYVERGVADLRVSDFLGGGSDSSPALDEDDDEVRTVEPGSLVRALDSCAVEWTVREPLVLLSPPSAGLAPLLTGVLALDLLLGCAVLAVCASLAAS